MDSWQSWPLLVNCRSKDISSSNGTTYPDGTYAYNNLGFGLVLHFERVNNKRCIEKDVLSDK